jgi:cytoskeletal protein RodZ
MSGTTTGIVVIVVVVVLGLAVWLAMIARAARRPAQAHPQHDPMRGLVQGGQHVGGGRSVAPTRDAPVPEGGGDPPDPEEEKAAYGRRSPMEDRGNPLDLE